MANTEANGPVSNGPMRRLKRETFPDQPADKYSSAPLTLANVRHLLQDCGVTAGWDLIRKRLVLTCQDIALCEEDLISLGNLNGMKGPDFWSFVHRIARDNPHNAVRTWILSKPWDGVDRLPAIISTITPTESYPEGLAAILIQRWLLSLAAAAVMAGGPVRFSARGVLTLQGGQGIGKSSWLASLVPAGEMRDAYFKGDHHMDGNSKDSILGVIPHWLAELGELDSSFRRDVSRLKGFLTNSIDRVRPPYGRKVEEFPRTTVFGASVNGYRFLVDDTGNSRFWTISAEKIDYNHQIDLQQLYAQLAVMLEGGAQWWLTPDEEATLALANRQHVVTTAIAERLHEYVDHDAIARGEGPYRTPIQVLRELGVDRPTNAQCKDMGAALRQLVGQPKRVNGDYKWRVPPNAKDYFVADAPLDPEDI